MLEVSLTISVTEQWMSVTRVEVKQNIAPLCSLRCLFHLRYIVTCTTHLRTKGQIAGAISVLQLAKLGNVHSPAVWTMGVSNATLYIIFAGLQWLHAAGVIANVRSINTWPHKIFKESRVCLQRELVYIYLYGSPHVSLN